MYLTEIFVELIKIYAPVVVYYIFTVILLDIITRAFRGV